MNIKSHNKFHDVKIINSSKIKDSRGYFLKNFYKELNETLKFEIDEVYYSKNIKNVIRGIHYQRTKAGLNKIIKCIDGEILDFFIDLRKNSPTYGEFDSVRISEENNLSIFIPYGFGHGFSVLSKAATVLYLQQGNYDKSQEETINPLSMGFDWKVSNPILSEKDRVAQGFTKQFLE
jgi:dTDP-4-dehydrorhamnose 3,5-epimerase